MTRKADPVAAAEQVKTERQAAQLHLDLESELALGDHGDDWEAAAEAGLKLLEDRFGGADNLREASGDRMLAPTSLSRSASRNLEAGSRADTGAERAGRQQGAASPSHSRHAESSRSPARRPSPRRRAGSRGRTGRAFERTGLPGAADSATGMVLQLVGVTVALVLLYVLVTGRGPKAVTIAAGSFSRGLRLFLAPVDPLKPGAIATAAQAPSSAPRNAHERATAAMRHAPLRRPGLAPGAHGQLRPT